MIQLERLIHSQGFGTRKICRTLILTGRVKVAGIVCKDPLACFDPGGEEGFPGIEFSIDGKKWNYRKNVYIMLNKPSGYECSHLPNHHPSVFSLFPQPLIQRGLQCVGRLDQDTTGLLLFSDDGQFIHRWSSGKKKVPKKYEVIVKYPVSEKMINLLLEGVQLKDQKEKISAASCLKTDCSCLEMVILEGKYHQVKRMIAATGNHVEKLHRKNIGGLFFKKHLDFGEWIWLEQEDFKSLADYT